MIVSEPSPSQSPIDALLSQPAKQELAREFFQAVDSEHASLRNQGQAINTVDGIRRKGYAAFITESGDLVEIFGYEKTPSAIETSPTDSDTDEVGTVIMAARKMMDEEVRVRGYLTNLHSNAVELISLEPFFPDAVNKLDARAREKTTFMQGIDHGIFFGHTPQARLQTPAEAISEVNARIVMRQVGVDEETATKVALAELANEGVYLLSINLRRPPDDPEAQVKVGMAWTNRVESEYFVTARQRNGFEI